MPVIDPSKNWLPLEERLARETNPKYRRQLEEVLFHIKVEAAGSIDRAIDRLSPDCAYRFFDNINEPVVIKGKEQIRELFYDQLVQAIHPDLQWTITRVIVDDGVVVTEGDLKTAMRGSTLAAAGQPVDPDPEAYYLSEGHHCVIWPFDDEGRVIGEEVYYGYSTPTEQVAKRPLALEDIGSFAGEVVDPS